jgi:hypothetical protein
MNPAVVAWVEATRRRQGLPPRVTDDRVLDEVAAIVAMGVERVTARAS